MTADVAIIGLACLFPGAHTPDEFWRNLLEGRDSTSLATEEDLGVDPARLFHPRPGQRDKTYWLRGGYVRDFRFDPRGYALPAELLGQLDETVKWSLYVARQALADAGLAALAQADLSRCGLLLGNLSFPTRSSHRFYAPLYTGPVEAGLAQLLGRALRLEPPGAGNFDGPVENAQICGSPAALAAAALRLGGPCFTFDAACASSLNAVHLACAYLAAGKADLMLAGAVSAADPLFVNMGFSIFRAYPESGSESRPLDRTSRGLVSGEGAGAFVLKRYADALRDGDRIYARIGGSGLSNDGHGRHLLTPNTAGQVRAFERAYASAGSRGIAPEDVAYVECHATGTPLGDPTELNAMAAFFGERGAAPLIGSVKSNFGHLLTAAGMAGMIKTVLAMVHGVIPPTIHVEDPLASERGAFGPRQIVRAATPWPDVAGRPRRAGVSAFGFGGTNAHLVLEAPGPASASPAASTPPVAPPKAPEKLAIVGMAAHFGGCPDLDRFARAVYDRPPATPLGGLPAQRWKGTEAHPETLARYGMERPPRGAYLDGFDADLLRYRVPPIASDLPIAQQMLLLKVADEALRDARLIEGGNVAVLIAMGTELSLHQYRGRIDLEWQVERALAQAGIALPREEAEALAAVAKDSVHGAAQVNQYTSFIGNVMASRVAARWDFSGPAFTISADENSAFRALEVAQLLLDAGEVEAVLVGAVDLAGGAESVAMRHWLGAPDDGRVSVSDRGADGWLVGEGAGAIVVKRLEDAREHGDRTYATVESVAFAPSPERALASRAPSPEAVQRAAEAALATAAVTPEEVGYLELHVGGLLAQDDAEIAGLTRAYRPIGSSGRPVQPDGDDDLICAIGNVKGTVGHTQAASGIAALIKVALCLRERTVPAAPAPPAGSASAAWQRAPFYAPAESRPWFRPMSAGRRVAAVSSLGIDGVAAHAILADAPATDRSFQTRPPGGLGETRLVPVVAGSVVALLSNLEALDARLAAGEGLETVAASQIASLRRAAHSQFTAALVGRTAGELRQEIARAREGIPAVVAAGGDWSTPLGSAFAAQPLGPSAKVTFVYPGGISSYAGQGRELYRAFPAAHDRLEAVFADAALVAGDRWLFPRSKKRLAPEQLRQIEARFLDDAFAVIAAGTGLALVGTALLREGFGIEPAAALGYSLGEATMLWALGVWGGGDAAAHALRASTAIGPRMSGPKRAAREFWGLDEAAQAFWATFLLLAPAERVAEALAAEPQVYLIMVNTPDEVCIAGDPAGCRRVIARLGCSHAAAPFNYVLHCEPMHSEYDGFVGLYTQPVVQRPEIAFYSSAEYAPLDLDEETIAHSIAQVVCQPLNFPRLVERAYQDGARVFIELGPAGACTRWVKTVLGEREHVAVSINQRGVDDHTALVRALARLLAHGVPMDLAPLVAGADDAGATPDPALDTHPSLVQHFTLGGPRICDTILAAGQRLTLTPASGDRPNGIASTASPGVRPPPSAPQTPPPAPPQARPVAPLRPQPPAEDLALSGADQPLTPAAQAHLVMLEGRRDGLRQMGELIALQLRAAEQAAGVDSGPVAPLAPVRQPVVWDEADLLEFARGSIARVFGPEWAEIDAYRRRVRLPLPPYLLVSRVTCLRAERGRFEPSALTTEYDIPRGAWYAIDGQIPWAVAVESGQCDLLLISYLGIDFENRGERVYRLLDCTLTFLDDLPMEGETLRYDISINDFARSGESLLFFFSYDCFVGERLVLQMRGGCAGFFSDAALAQGRGVIVTDAEREAQAKITRRTAAPLLVCARQTFGYDDLLALSRGDLAACFGPDYDPAGRNPSLRLDPPAMLMVDRIVSVERDGGAWGLGQILAEKDLHPDDWYFPCHFKDDEVLAGSLIAQGCVQLLSFYLLHAGVQTLVGDARFQPIPGLAQQVRCRGQVTTADTRLTYRMEITEVGLHPLPYAKANVDVIVDRKVVVRFDNVGMQVAEKEPAKRSGQASGAQRPAAHQRPAKIAAPAALFDERHITEFATGSIVACFGSDFSVYEGRRAPRTPNGALQLISRIVAFDGRRRHLRPMSSLTAEYDVPLDAWFVRENAAPVTPYSILMELALQPCGFLSAHLGSTLSYEDADFFFRNLDGTGRLSHAVDLRGKTVRNTVRLLSSTAIEGVVVQKFDFSLSCDGERFYRGDAAFGYFTPNTLANQVGLDRGQAAPPWLDRADWRAASERTAHHDVEHRDVELASPSARHLYQGSKGAPNYRLAGGRLDFLDRVAVAPQGGKVGAGYVYAERRVRPDDWFFACHFFEDPVMPGSLGVEAILEAMQAFALETDLGAELRSPAFAHLLDNTTVWKYRGQIVPTSEWMRLEAHVTRVVREPGRVTLIADASLWRDRLRIYEVRDLALQIVEADSLSEGSG